MRKSMFSHLFLVASIASASFAQTNIFPSTGNAGIWTTSPGTALHISTDGTNSPWLALDKSSGQETGIQFRKAGNILFYLYSDNDAADALKIQSTGVTGENDLYPRIHIPYDSKDLFLGLSGGNVAIGHKFPYAPSRLHIKANVVNPWTLVSEASTNSRIIGMSHDGTNGMISVSYLDNSGYSPLQFRTSNVARLTIDVDGNIGIGTSSPNEKLTVNGTIYGKEVKVDLSVPGPDYVFEEEYDLRTLEEVQTYVNRYKHLPEVPSASEMEENGINLSEMNLLLLKKIEELTLYMIDLKQENEEIKKHLDIK